MIQSKRLFAWLAVALVFQSVCLAQSNASADRDAISEQALRLGFKGDYRQALELLRIGQEQAEKNPDKASLAMMMVDSAVVYAFFQRESLKALPFLVKLPKLAEIEHDKKALAHVLSRLAFLGYYRNAHAQALEQATRSLSLLDPTSDKVEIAFTLNVLGMNSRALGNSEQARRYYEESLKVCASMKDEFWKALPLNNLGYLYHTLEDEAAALRCYHESLALIERFGIKSLLGYTLNNMGGAYLAQGDYSRALDYFQRSLVERQAAGRKDEISTTLRDIGATWRSQGDYPKARDYYRKSLAIEESLGNKSRISGRLSNIGSAYLDEFNFDLALEYYQKSLKAAQEGSDHEGIAAGFFSIGQVYATQNNYDLALDYYKKGLPASETSGHRKLTGAILIAMGTVCREKGDYDQALDHYQRSLSTSGSIDVRMGASIDTGYMYYLQGRYDKALEYFRNCLELSKATGEKGMLHGALNLIAVVYCAQGNYAEALSAIGQAYELARQLRNPDRLYGSRQIAARAYRGLGQTDKARQAYDEAIATVEDARNLVAGDEQDRQRFFQSRVSPYYEMVALLVDQNQINEALAYAERAKARVLLEVLQNGKINITKAMTAEEQQRERRLKDDLISLNSQITNESLRRQADQTRLGDLNERLKKARLDHEAFQISLYAAHSELKTKRGESQPFKLDEADALIQDAKTAFVEYVVTDDKTYLFAITRSAGSSKAGLKVYSIDIKRKALVERAEAFRAQLASRDIGFRQSARDLYDLLLKPAQSDLQGKSQIVIVPDGALWELPFQALQPDANRYLIEDAAISYAPSLSVLREMIHQRRRPSGKSPLLLAFGNPALSGETIERARATRRDDKLEPLPETEKEVRALQALYGTTRSRVYTGANAREDTIKAEAGNADVLHMATHGILNDSSPMYSRVVLSRGDANEDGMLEAWEIMKLDLRAEIVALSACETARGRVSAGEGMIGLTWAFFVAGTPTTVVSQWKVDAAGTSQLMVDFHRNLRTRFSNPRSLMTRAEALRAAALKMLRSEQYKHPFYWAGFIVVGDGF